MADFGGGIGGVGGIGGGGDGGNSLHLTYSAQLFCEATRRGEVQVWEGDESDMVAKFRDMKVGEVATDYKLITAANDTWGTPFVGGIQAPRRSGKVWTMSVTIVQLRKCYHWTLDFAEVQKDIRTWLQDLPGGNDGSPNEESPDLSKLALWEKAKDIQDMDDYNAFKTVDGVALEGNTLKLAKMIRKGIESYTIHTPVPTLTFRYFDEVDGTGGLLDKYLTPLPSGPANWEELGGADIHGQLLQLTYVQGPNGTITYKWLCTADKSTSNGDGSSTRTIQFMRVDSVQDELYDEGDASDGGLA